MDINRTCITGRLGRDPEVRFTQGGKPVCNFSVAVSGGRDKTTWLTVTVWDKAAEACGQFLNKGSRVAVTGRLEQREWTDKQGAKRTQIDLVADGFGGVVFLDPKGSSPQSDAYDGPPPPSDDSVPF